jgi:steroid 5-alpha reductase family enzyme
MSPTVHLWLQALPVLLGAAALTWLVSVPLRNVTLADVLWPVLFVLAAFAYAFTELPLDARSRVLLALVTLWGLRLAAYLLLRTLGHEEDRRYAALRRRHEPGFAWKSLALVFVFQALLAWVVSVPLLGATTGTRQPLGWLDGIGIALWGVGFLFETVGDWQLSRFKADPANAQQVMDRGLWRYTRHPNYFGDFCVWWGFYLLALANGAWWTIVGPLIMSVLLLRVSGVTLLERHIGKRRPGYAEYARRTSTFFPRPPRA